MTHWKKKWHLANKHVSALSFFLSPSRWRSFTLRLYPTFRRPFKWHRCSHTPHFLYNVLLIVAVHTYKHLSMYVVCMYVYLDIRSILVKGDTFFFQRINKSHLHTEKIKTKRTQTHHFPWCNSTLCIASCRDVAAEELHHANYQLQRQGGKEKEEEKKSIREVW